MYKRVGSIDMSKYELPSHTERVVGQQLRFNHIDCEAGVDTKQRLYVKAVDTGWIAYCHHCGKSGFLRTSPYRVGMSGDIHYPADETRTYKDVPSKYKGASLIVDPVEFPVEQLLWLYSYGFTDADIKYFNVKVSKVDGSIVIPHADGWNESHAYYVRRKYTDHFDRGPKAILYKQYPDKHFVWYHIKTSKTVSPDWIITEDPISAMKLCKCSANVISLMGTNLTDEVKKFLTDRGAKRILIYLDPDTAGMKAALKIRKQLQSIVEDTQIYCDGITGVQPKDERPEVLQQIVKDFYK